MNTKTETYDALVTLLKAQIEINSTITDEELDEYLQEIGVCQQHMRERMIKDSRI